MDSSFNPLDSQYIVQPGDSLDSLALQFSTTVHWLKKSNNLNTHLIFPGDILEISAPPIEIDETPIKASLFVDGSDKTPGQLQILHNILLFTPTNEKAPPIKIDLLGHLESAVMPHPITMAQNKCLVSPDSIHILVLTYLSEPSDRTTMTVIFFSACNHDISHIAHSIQLVAQNLQLIHSYSVPNPNHLSHKSFHPSSLPEQHSINIEPPPVRRQSAAEIEFNIQSTVFTPEEALYIREKLPYRIRSFNWTRVFSLSIDGSSYSSFFAKTERIEPLLLVLRTDKGDRIGAYLSHGLHAQKRFYGSGECFVFKLMNHSQKSKLNPQMSEKIVEKVPDINSNSNLIGKAESSSAILSETFTRSSHNNNKKREEFSHWGWSGANQYFVSSTNSEISIGGGGSAAIWIDGKFLKGFSESCTTFNSPQLTLESHFKILDVEVWKIANAANAMKRHIGSL